MSRSLFGTRFSQVLGTLGAGGRLRQHRSKARRFAGLEYLEGRTLMAGINASGVISSAAAGTNFNYTITLTNPSSSTSAVGTFWYAWVPGQDYLATSPSSVTPPSGWSDQITNEGAHDGFAILFTANTAGSYVQPGSSLNFSFTSADSPASVDGNSVFFPSVPVNTSVVYPAAPFSVGGDQFVVTSATPASPTITGEHVAAINLKHNKHGKPIGQPVLSFVFQFSTAMDQASVTNTNNYQLDWVSTKKVKKQVQTVLHRVAIKSATYAVSTNSVTLVTSAMKSTFPKGGQVTVISSPSSGVDSATEASLAGTTVFTISPKASTLVP